MTTHTLDSLREMARSNGAGPDDYIIASPHGLGDTYMVAALSGAFRERYCRGERALFFIAKSSHVDLIRMFDQMSSIVAIPDGDMDAVMAELEQGGHQAVLRPGEVFFAHSHVVRIDPCAVAGRMTHAITVALALGLDAWTPLALPGRIPGNAEAAEIATRLLCVIPGRTAVLFPGARSWLAPELRFWTDLTAALEAEGWHVVVNDEAIVPLRCVPAFVETAGWAIGANSGIMQIIVSARTRCHKTLLTRLINGRGPHQEGITPHHLIDGQHYDIEEFGVPDDWSAVITAVARGRNARGPMPSAQPQMMFEVALAPGEILDRLTVLRLKQERLPNKAHMFHREIAVLSEHRDTILRAVPAVVPLEQELYRLNATAWDNNQILFDTMTGGYGDDHWSIDHEIDKAERCLRAFKTAGIVANQERVRLKNRINALCGSSDREEKSYDT